MQNLNLQGASNCHIFDEQKIGITNCVHNYKINIETKIKLLVTADTTDCNNYPES